MEDNLNTMQTNFESRLPKLYQTEKIGTSHKIAKIKLTNTRKDRCWYIVEGEALENDYLFWGLVKHSGKESLEFFTLNDLGSLALAEKSRIIEDKDFWPSRLSDITTTRIQ